MIYFSANTRAAKASTDDVITQYSVGIPVHIQLSDEFNGLQRILVFRNKSVAVDLVYLGGDVILPQELTDTVDTIYIGCYAALPDGTIVIPTIWDSVGPVAKATEPSEIDPREPTPSWAAQTQAMSTEALENSVIAKEAAVTAQNSAAANAAIAEAAAQRAAYSADTDIKVNFYITDGDLYAEAVQ